MSNNQRYDHQQGDRLEHPLNQTTPDYVNALVEAALSVAYKLALESVVRHGARDQIFQALSLFFYMGRSLGTRLMDTSTWILVLRLSPVVDYQVLLFFISFRAEASLHRVAELNPYVTVTASTQPLHSSSDLSFLRAFQVP